MLKPLFNWFLSWSIRWKLQFGFFIVTMITTIFNRWLASSELGKMITLARDNAVSPDVIKLLVENRDTFIFNSFWESGIEFSLQFLLIAIVASMFVRPIKSLCAALKSVEQGDLTHEVPHHSRDEIGVLEESFNDVVTKLNHIMCNVDESGQQMSQSAYQIATISREIAEVGKNEQQRSEEVSNATRQVQDISETVKQLAQDAAQRALTTEQRAQEGIHTVQLNIAEMQQTALQVDQAAAFVSDLDKTAQLIHNIIATIRNIAEQTNLLALNAAIEAARAGDHGRGFAVVADEVRNLASNTTESVSEISDIISDLSGKVRRVTDTMATVVSQVQDSQRKATETADVIGAMAQEVTETAVANSRISDAIGEQLQQINNLNGTLQDLFATLDDSSSKVETTAGIGDSLYSLTENLNEILAGFTFEDQRLIDHIQHEKRRHPRLHSRLLIAVEQNGKMIEGLTDDISLEGTRIRLPRGLQHTQNLNLVIRMPANDVKEYEDKPPLRITGNVTWDSREKQFYVYGIHFNACNPAQERMLRECFQFHKAAAEFPKH